MNYAGHIADKSTPQSEPLLGRESEQKQNRAGGHTFVITPWQQLDRFLMLGSEKGTYYAGEHEMTVENAQNVLACIHEDAHRVMNRVVEFSTQGRVAKQSPLIFVAALCACKGKTVADRQAALNNLEQVCRIPTHLFQFLSYVRQLGGFGKGKRNSISRWYNLSPPDRLAYHMVKYKSRHGWTHRDALRIAHTTPVDKVHSNLYAWAADKEHDVSLLPPVILAANSIKKPSVPIKAIQDQIREYRLPRECLPSELLNKPEVWDALLDDMPTTALVRNLGKMTKVGLLGPLSDGAKRVCAQLADTERLRKSRIHPMQILIAMRTYESGHGDKGKLSWVPNPHVVDALDSAFYESFANVEPTGKSWYIGLDVSSSMSMPIAGYNLSCAEAGAALSMAVLRSEQFALVRGFTGDMRDLNFTARTRLDDALARTRKMNFGRTDCALPMLDALERGIEVDVFLVATDNETWFGNVHPCAALKRYREQMNPQAKLVVLAMTATNFSIADPKDAGMLDMAGLDSGMFPVLREFVMA